jgi:hypothetical protein
VAVQKVRNVIAAAAGVILDSSSCSSNGVVDLKPFVNSGSSSSSSSSDGTVERVAFMSSSSRNNGLVEFAPVTADSCGEVVHPAAVAHLTRHNPPHELLHIWLLECIHPATLASESHKRTLLRTHYTVTVLGRRHTS